MGRKYPTDLSDEEWACLKARFPPSKSPGRPRAHSLRDIFDAIFYVLKSSCPWRLLPHDFPPWSTVYYHFRKLRLSGVWGLIYRALRSTERKRVGKNPDPSAAIMDSQSIKTTEEGAQSNGYDAHKVMSKRWIVERTFSWLVRNRHLSKDYERRAQTSETLIEVAMIRLLLRRLARKA